jgi:hypothetical protein
MEKKESKLEEETERNLGLQQMWELLRRVASGLVKLIAGAGDIE